jgi:hypothetical protein
VVQVVKHLPSNHEALSSISSSEKKKLLVISLTKKVKDLYKVNHKPLKKTLQDGKVSHAHE